jgi:hypothetical protein
LVSTVIEPGLDVDPLLMSRCETRAWCHSKWSWKIVDREREWERENSRIKTEFGSEKAWQFIDDVEAGHSDCLKMGFKFTLFAILGTCLETMVRIVEMLQDQLTSVSGLFACVSHIGRCNVINKWTRGCIHEIIFCQGRELVPNKQSGRKERKEWLRVCRFASASMIGMTH